MLPPMALAMGPKKTVSGPKLKIGLVQRICGEEPEANIERALEGAHEATSQGAKIVCLQELFYSLYFCREFDEAFFDMAEPLDGPAVSTFRKFAKKHDAVVIVPIFERRAPGVYHNTAVIVDAGGEIAGVYRKMHIPDDPGFYEKYYFTPGDTGFKAFDTKYGRIASLICWDQWYPEGARLAALHGAQIVFYPTAIGWIPQDPPEVQRSQREAWQTIQRAHAIANGVFVAAPNRVGQEGETTFWGTSFVSDPFGRIIGQAGEDEDVLVVECDLGVIEATRRQWPFLRDRRIDAYGDINKRLLDIES